MGTKEIKVLKADSKKKVNVMIPSNNINIGFYEQMYLSRFEEYRVNGRTETLTPA